MSSCAARSRGGCTQLSRRFSARVAAPSQRSCFAPGGQEGPGWGWCPSPALLLRAHAWPGQKRELGELSRLQRPEGLRGASPGDTGGRGGGRDGHAGHSFGATPCKRGAYRQRAWDSAGGGGVCGGKQVPKPVSSGSGPKRRLPMVN